MSENWQTRQTLLQRAQNPDDHQAWDEFTHYYREFIKMVLFQMKCHTGDHEDLVQEILVKIWKNLPNLDYDKDRAKFRTWLGCLIRNRVLDHFRKVKRMNDKQQAATEETLGNVDRNIMSEPELADVIQKEWEVHIIKLAINNIRSLFSERAIEAFEMDLEGKKTAEIAAHIGIKSNSVIKLKNRVKHRLIKEIQHLRDELESV